MLSRGLFSIRSSVMRQRISDSLDLLRVVLFLCLCFGIFFLLFFVRALAFIFLWQFNISVGGIRVCYYIYIS